MATLTNTGLASGLLSYTDSNEKNIKLVISHIVDYFDAGNNILIVEQTSGVIRMKLDNQTAVNTAIALLDSKF